MQKRIDINNIGQAHHDAQEEGQGVEIVSNFIQKSKNESEIRKPGAQTSYMKHRNSCANPGSSKDLREKIKAGNLQQEITNDTQNYMKVTPLKEITE